jgi:hypothetical protein
LANFAVGKLRIDLVLLAANYHYVLLVVLLDLAYAPIQEVVLVAGRGDDTDGPYGDSTSDVARFTAAGHGLVENRCLVVAAPCAAGPSNPLGVLDYIHKIHLI